MRLVVLIGHRGTGKTALLKRWKIYQPEAVTFDLDEEIEKLTGLSVVDFFHKNGEAEFRIQEVKIFESLLELEAKTQVIACGAGFNLTELPQEAHVIWVRRDSDSKGRIFTDRPRLNASLAPLDEYHRRFYSREPLYMSVADQIYTVPEGLQSPDLEEKEILLGRPSVDAVVTLLKDEKLSPLNQNVTFEWRDDLLTESEFLEVTKKHSNKKILFSVRTPKSIPTQALKQNSLIDWDLQRPLPESRQVHILSTHENHLATALQKIRPYEGQPYHLKLSPLIETWEELEQGFLWQQTDPQGRNFLPRSRDGRWAWFRLFMKAHQKLNFVREAHGSSQDQPTLWQWLSAPRQAFRGFAAVLGFPIDHSYSPAFHKAYFMNLKKPFFKIPLIEKEWNVALPLLEKWGLQFAAVTAPLKLVAGEWVKEKGPINTLIYDKIFQTWKGFNTDALALNQILSTYKDLRVVVWGGGGLVPSLRAALPEALYYSARTGQPRDLATAFFEPEVIIWAAGNADLSTIPQQWKPKLILDMSYTENSPAREWAQKTQSQYKSGLELFETQAELQQKLWESVSK